VAVDPGETTASETRIEYCPRPDATPEGELAALAAVYSYLLDLYEEKAGEEVAGGEEEPPRASPQKRSGIVRPKTSAPNLRAKLEERTQST
jgi:hypothetical protein